MREERTTAASGSKEKREGPFGLLSHNGTVAWFGGVFKSVAADEAKEKGKRAPHKCHLQVHLLLMSRAHLYLWAQVSTQGQFRLNEGKEN